MANREDVEKRWAPGGDAEPEPYKDVDPRQNERNPVLMLLLILLGVFVVGILSIVFYPTLLDSIFGN